jgi:aspartate aminotransferase
VAEFTQHAAVEALRDRAEATPHMVAEFHRRRDQFTRDLDQVPGFACAPPAGAFYAWVSVAGAGASAEDVCRIMLEQAGVAAIPGAAFGASGKDFIRFSFASSLATLRDAIERIQRVSGAWARPSALR